MANKRFNQSSIISIILIAFNIGGYILCNYLAKQFSTLPILELPKANVTEKIIDIKTLYPVLVEISKHTEKSETLDSNAEAAFIKQEPVKHLIIAAPIDYIGMVKSSIKLDAISGDGAFINGKYYKSGEVIISAAIQDGIINIKPILLSIGNNSVVIGIGKRKITVRFEA